MVTEPVKIAVIGIGALAEELRSFLAACRGAAVPKGCRIQDAVQVQSWMEQLLTSTKTKRDGLPKPGFAILIC